MSFLLYAQIAVAGVAAAFGVLHFTIALRHEAKGLYLCFALFSFSAAVDAALTAVAYRSTTVAEFLWSTRWAISSRDVFALCAIWFVTFYARKEITPYLKALSVFWIVVIFLNTIAPYSIFREAPQIRTILLPWGEGITASNTAKSLQLILPNIVASLSALYGWSSISSLKKRGETRKARRFELALATLVFVAFPEGLLINRGFLNPPYLYSFAYLPLLIIMSFDLIDDAVQTAELSRRVLVSEHRWRTLLENVNLMVVGADRDGLFNYLNPFFLKATGYPSEELLGRNIETISPKTDAPKLAERYRRIIEGTQPGEEPSVNRVMRKDGTIRTVHWSTVPILGEQGEVTGVLSVGADTTDREEAEAARDKAIRDLEQIRERLEAENLYLKEEAFSPVDASGIIGQSAAIRHVLHKIAEVAKTQATVLILGETGSGKELVARAIHNTSERAKGPYIRVNCSVLPASLAESELFGHEKGSFTSADKLRRGRFELADGGTLLLDEVGELPLEIQTKLLRILQEGEYERVGGSQTRKADVRIIAATNRDLKKEVSAGRFREDLYYRLQVYPITLPPLRDRRDDIPLLVESFTQRFARKHGKQISEVPGHFVKLLTQQAWPGNIRELENVIERAVISSSGPELRASFGDDMETAVRVGSNGQTSQTLEAVERLHLLSVINAAGWKIAGEDGAAHILGMHPNTLRSRMAKLKLVRPAPTRSAPSNLNE